ncbi:undecaprenyl-diphosphate phosphatase [Pedobacter gandavensis]|uniref:undecaprenyl-diphosphate phosphatase n=1 Tax=Pedobacter TaxID=84567 RepID=UPI000705BCC2|nr:MULTISPECIES: undecaprenyl-diphosphate phosphatase [Pedobacter]ALL04677.1 UDP-diphosphatase [Pedobacter sp. PACM 27299]WGQ12267.1 undecaprenyl-diphosphate phosphatase [Pedobacter gandavensis]
MNYLQALILAIIEGLTEFLPVSSTGHMVIASAVMGIGNDEFVKLFEVAIQLGAILAVVVLYWKKFFDFSKWQFYVKLLIAVIPALGFGYLLNDFIDDKLGSPIFIAVILLLGGIVLLFIDKVFKNPEIDHEADITNMSAFKIGCFQVLAVVFPGLSRSAATIIGGMQQKLTRHAAAEFSFFLAVPTMCAATGYKLLKGAHLLNGDNIKLLLFGNVIAFIVAIIAIKSFIGFLSKHGFRVFGYYRIIIGVVILALYFSGIDLAI